MSLPEEEMDQQQPEEQPEENPRVGETPAPAEENWKDQYLRCLAELDNMRKRGERERASARKFALEALMRDLLPVLDALEFAAAAEGDAKSIREGVQMALDSALRVLQSHGLETIEAHGESFDPRFHEAVGVRPPEGDLKPNTVALEERKGYSLNERVLRPSRVHIVMAPPQAADADKDQDADV
ncbi:MAG: nucleotide exchange factor GrpE [Planctomycetota bacterium]